MASPFASKLGTNYCPNDDEVLKIQTLLVEPTLRLKRLDDEITEMQNTINKLIKERESLGAYVQAHAALISPTRRLPLDIIQEIFVACLPTHRNCVMSASEAPVLLGRICSSWRTISLSTPRLWASLHIVDRELPSRHYSDVASTHIVTLEDLKGAQIVESLSIPFGAFYPTASHLIGTSAVLKELVHLSGMDVPMLESVALHQSDPYAASEFAWNDLGILRGSNIASVYVSGSDIEFLQLPLPWTRLENLSNFHPIQHSPQAISGEGALQTISSCPRLRGLWLQVDEGLTSGIRTYPLVEHHLLDTLYLAGNITSSLLLGGLSLPGLKEFTFLMYLQRTDEHWSADEVGNLVHFLTNSSLLESVQMDVDQFSSISCKEILRSLPPSLLRLHLNSASNIWSTRSSSLNDGVLELITPSPALPTPFPALQDFCIQYCNVISDAALLRFIAARVPTLKRVEADFHRGMELDIRPDLLPFIENGLEASIMHHISTPKISPWAEDNVLPLNRALDPETGAIASVSARNGTIPRDAIRSPPFMPKSRVGGGRCSILGAFASGGRPEFEGLLVNVRAAEAVDFEAKLGTNYCPNDDEVVEIQTLLVEHTLRLKRLDDEITEMQNTINKLIKERDNLGAYVQAHAALISPTRRLPLDIIQEIFVACLPTDRNCVMSAREAPVLLGRICSSWRTISLSTPRLWASLHIVGRGVLSRNDNDVASTLEDSKAAQILEVTQTWLGRSGQCPLSISLHSPHPLPSAHFILQLLISLASRWQSVQFTTHTAVLKKLVHLSGMDVPILESVALHQSDRYTASEFAWNDLGILRGSNIASVYLSGSGIEFLQLPLPWTRLENLSNSHPIQPTPQAISGEGVLQTISSCPRLRGLWLQVDEGPTSEIRTYPLVEHHLLDTLYLAGNITSSLLLGGLSLPGLKEFTFRMHLRRTDEHWSADDVGNLIRFLNNSSLLESVQMGIEQFSSISWKEILRSLPPSLLRLHLNNASNIWTRSPSLNDDVLELITPSPGLPTPFPALQDFCIQYCNGISDAALLRFIAARVPTLKRVEADFRRGMELDVRPDLLPFIENGLEASIMHRIPSAPKFSPWEGLTDSPARRPW
ncbi:hypothetical protein B0H11DRAFT_2267867 [Mycena galericulata]|nr:hypothetical protein B0H11DRAFT_2267867 [Mycena galericulata]